MTILLLKGYNNYFNRIVKQETSITAYKTASTSYLEYPNVNFDPQDGIATTLIVGGPTQQEDVVITGRPTIKRVLKFDELGNPDYLIVHDNTNIVSKWFILESVKIRQGQYKLALKRDVLADFNYFLKKAPCYVEKGTITDPQNPLLFNSEGMKFNEIKQDEILLKDKTNCAWLVGYIKKDINSEDPEISTHIHVDYTSPEDLPGEIYDVNELDWGAAINYADDPGSGTKIAFNLNKNSSKMLLRVRYHQYAGPSASSWLNRNIQLDLDGNFIKIDDSGNLSTYALNLAGADQWTTLNTLAPFGSAVSTVTKVDSEANTAFNNLITDAKSKQSDLIFTTDDPSSLNGAVIVKSGALYTLSVTKVTDEYSVPYSIGESNSKALAYLGTIDGSYQIPDTGTPAGSGNFTATVNNTNPGDTRMSVVFSGTRYVINATPYVADETVSYTLPYSSQRSTCEDAQYDMFAMPIDPSVLGITVNTSDVRFYDDDSLKCKLGDISSVQMAISALLCSKLGAGTSNGYCYDLQVLPYCPIPNIATVSGYDYTRINLHSLTSYDYEFLEDNATPDHNIRGIVFYPRKANFNTRAILPLVTPNKQIPLENKHAVQEQKAFSQAIFYYSQMDTETNFAIYDYKFPYPVLDSDEVVENAFNNSLIEVPNTFNVLLEAAGTYKDSQGYVHLYAEWDLTDAPQIPPWPSFINYAGQTFKATFNWLMPDEAEQIKVNNECDFQRLVSPNYNGMFQFNKARMIDGIHYIDVDCTYKPYTPYIKLNPDFSGLYGQDWNDSTGLICGGDFSIPMMSDAFTNYELANRNYQAVFNRQIENLDVNQQIAKEQQQFQGIVGIVTGGIGGAGAGAYAGFKASGSPWGAVAGAAVGAIGGTALSGIGYEKDRQWLREQQAEARDFSIDQFNYQLGNIQALPQSMTKSSPLSFNNKIWPIMEFFSCTPEEKDVLRSKLRYNGMTIMAVGSLNDYSVTGGYLKGKLIRLSDIDDDSHIAQAIYEEVDKGFYEGE